MCFDLNTAVAAWRRPFEAGGALSADDLEELERHLRDHVAALVAQGWAEEDAFHQAVRKVGAYAATEAEYAKVFWPKAAAERRIVPELRWRISMLKNYLTIAWRTLRRHPGYTGINIVGLAVSLAACLVLGLYVAQSLTYDRFHEAAARTVRVVQFSPEGEGHATMPPGLGRAIEGQFPEVETVTHVLGGHSYEHLFLRGDARFEVDGVMTVDERFFDVFSFEILRGSAEAALATPNQLILTASTARRIFGDEDPLGQTLSLGGTTDYTVAAIAADPPPNTHLPFNAIRSLGERDQQQQTGAVRWNFFHARIYAKLNPGADVAAFAEKLNAFQEAERPPEQGQAAELIAQPLTSIHLQSDLNGEYAPTSDVRYLYLFGAAGLLILLIACVNYVNLATARAARRAREVGVRKVVGARRSQLIGQFLSESTLLVLLALPLALGLAALALPAVNELAGQAISLRTANHPLAWLGALGLLMLVGVGAGGYPALALSAFRPVGALKGGPGRMRGRHALRRALIVGQFAATFALVAGALAVYLQLDFLQTKRLGFDTEQIVTFQAPEWQWDGFGAFKASLGDDPSILSVTHGAPLGINWRSFTMARPIAPGSDETWEVDAVTVGYDYAETMGLTLLAGRSFSRDFPTDSARAALVTASAVEQFELEGDGVGGTVDLIEELTVVGVVEDFHNVSLKEPVKPMVVMLDPALVGTILARLAPGRVEAGLATLEAAWAAHVPERPFRFEFLDERIQAQYLAEERLSRMFGLFAGLAVALAALGLFGLAAFSAQQRTKEIGIRKALGASVGSIIRLLTREFVALVGVAVIVAVPLAWLGLERWLSEFAYRIAVGPGLFVLAGGLALAVAVLAVSVQAARAARANPVEALRYE